MNQNYSKVLCERIIELRKKHGYTQEILAEKLGITFQAVSKWETLQSCPDITLLPVLADIFGVHIDELFGREVACKSNFGLDEEISWNDDNKIRALIFKGRKLMKKPVEEAMKFTFEYKGEALNIESYLPIVCGDVQGNVSATAAVTCGSVGGNVSSNQSITCVDVSGSVNANGTVICADVKNGVSTNSSLTCADVSGNAQCNGNMTCARITGDVEVNVLKCREIHGKVYVKKFENYSDD